MYIYIYIYIYSLNWRWMFLSFLNQQICLSPLNTRFHLCFDLAMHYGSLYCSFNYSAKTVILYLPYSIAIRNG